MTVSIIQLKVNLQSLTEKERVCSKMLSRIAAIWCRVIVLERKEGAFRMCCTHIVFNVKPPAGPK